MAEYLHREEAVAALDVAEQFLRRLPAVDVVKVVRCKNCKHYKKNPYGEDDEMMCMCWADWLPTDDNDFCSYGEWRVKDELVECKV